MKKTILYSIIFLLGFHTMVRAAEPVNVMKSADIPSVTTVQALPTLAINDEILRFQDQIDKLRDENYQRAIKSAEQAGEKADSFINAVVGLATIFGLVLTVVSVVFGGSIFTLIHKLDAQVARAKKGANFVDRLFDEAKQQQSKLQQEFSSLETKSKELEGLAESGKSKDRKEIESIKTKVIEIQKVTQQVQGTINELRSLRNSARYVSGATGSAVNVGDIGMVGIASPGSAGVTGAGIPYGSGFAGVSLAGNRVCKYCGRSELDSVGTLAGGIGSTGPTEHTRHTVGSLASDLLTDFGDYYVCSSCRSMDRS